MYDMIHFVVCCEYFPCWCDTLANTYITFLPNSILKTRAPIPSSLHSTWACIMPFDCHSNLVRVEEATL